MVKDKCMQDAVNGPSYKQISCLIKIISVHCCFFKRHIWLHCRKSEWVCVGRGVLLLLFGAGGEWTGGFSCGLTVHFPVPFQLTVVKSKRLVLESICERYNIVQLKKITFINHKLACTCHRCPHDIQKNYPFQSWNVERLIDIQVGAWLNAQIVDQVWASYRCAELVMEWQT